MYRLEILSVDPGHAWIKAFVADLVTRDTNPDNILYFARFLAQGMTYMAAKKAYEDASRQHIQSTVHPLLPRKEHKHFLRDAGRLHLALARDPKAIVIYDTTGIQDEDPFPSLMDVDTFIRDLIKEHGSKRVLSRDDALSYLCNL